MQKIILRALGAAAGEAAYISLVVSIMSNSEKLFRDKPEMLLGMLMLTLLVVSAAVSAALVFGGPVLLYLEGKKQDAIKFFIATICWLVVFMLVALSLLMF